VISISVQKSIKSHSSYIITQHPRERGFGGVCTLPKMKNVQFSPAKRIDF